MRGIVTLDGKPVVGAAVLYVPIGGGLTSWGQTNEQGQFELTATDGRAGAVIGKHQLAVTLERYEGTRAETKEDVQLDGGPIPGQEVKVIFVLPAHYARTATSGLEFEVTETGASHEIALSSDANPK